MNQSEREFDIILWGATGFTGQLVAEYLVARYGSEADLRWALGGRNESKLTALRERLEAPELPIVLGDGDDATSLAQMVGRARVICTTVGPYALYGSKLVEACARNGTHYCDLTGELHWIRRMIDAHQSDAEASGAMIVPTCGFDSIPSDLGTFFVQREARSRFGRPSSTVKGGVKGFSGGASGGTIASMMAMMEEASHDSEVTRILSDPYAINPSGRRHGRDGKDRTSPFEEEAFGEWTAPFVMAAVNTRVVRRSAALLHYGDDFSYEETMLTGPGLRGAMRAASVAMGMGVGMGVMALSPLRRLAGNWLPAPGEGPSRKQQAEGYWDLRFWAAAPGGSSESPIRVKATGDRDPGYGSTSKMLAESAVCLAKDELAAGGGFHTPASAMGDALVDRLQKSAGVSFELLE